MVPSTRRSANGAVIRQRLSKRALLILTVHAVIFVLVYWLAFGLRYDFAIPQKQLHTFWLTLPALLLLKVAIFYALGHCHGWWRYVTFSDLVLLLRAATLSTLVIAALNLFAFSMDDKARSYHNIPRSVLLLDWGMTILFLGGLRGLWRLSREEFHPLLYRKQYNRAFIVGADQVGESLARLLQSDPRLKYTIAGFLDHDGSRHGMRMGRIPVLGKPSDAPRLASAFGVSEVLVISGHLPGKELRGLMQECERAKLNVKVLPSTDDLLNSNYHMQVRDVDINDLLRREPVTLSDEAISSLLHGRTVMVTGAGGSIGSEICRQVLRFRPSCLVLVERAENNLFLIDQELAALGVQTRLVPCVADILDAPRMHSLFATHAPDVIFHAAAHKHVPMMEYNPGEALKNNVLGTRQLVELADQYGVKNFVFISTDKAVNPTSVMGVSKQLAERCVHSFSETSATKFVVVRFGNVLGSAGSVVPIFQEQIRRGGPLSVTHPDMQRFFMTIPEASQLVLQAAAMGKGGEIFVLDMGEPVKIVDLARDLIRLSGFDPDEIGITFTGLRPGEKLYEELYFDSEATLTTPHPKLFVAYHRSFSLEEIDQAIRDLSDLLHAPPDVLRERLKVVLPEYLSSRAVPETSAAVER